MSARLPPPELPAWIEDELAFERYRVDVGGLRMHVMEAGAGRPVLMLHGNPTWGFLYRKVARLLGDAPLRLIAPDLVGLGFSDRPGSAAEHTLERHAGWVASLVRALELDDVVLVVQDWGGPIGVGAFAFEPELAQCMGGLVVLNTVLAPPRPGFRPTFFHRLAHVPLVAPLLFRGLGFPQNALALAQGERASIAGRVARAYRYPLTRRRGNAAPLALARMVPDSLVHPSVAPLARVAEFVERWRGPAAIVWGERDPILGRLHARTARALPQATLELTGAGHFLQEEVPAEIAAAITRTAGLA